MTKVRALSDLADADLLVLCEVADAIQRQLDLGKAPTDTDVRFLAMMRRQELWKPAEE